MRQAVYECSRRTPPPPVEYGLDPVETAGSTGTASANHALMEGFETASCHRVARPDFRAVANPAPDNVDKARLAVVGDTPKAAATLRPESGTALSESTLNAWNAGSLSVASSVSPAVAMTGIVCVYVQTCWTSIAHRLQERSR